MCQNWDGMKELAPILYAEDQDTEKIRDSEGWRSEMTIMMTSGF